MVDKYEKYKHNIALCFDLASTHFEEELQEDINDCCTEILKCIDELKEYKKIGTVEQLEWCKDASHWKELFKEKLEQYEAIGTIEEFKALKEKENKDFKLLLKAVKESYPMFKSAYVEPDVFMGDVMRKFAKDRQQP